MTYKSSNTKKLQQKINWDKKIIITQV